MNETTTNATTPKTEKRVGDPSKRAADPFELSRATMSKFEMPKIEVPAELREMTDKGMCLTCVSGDSKCCEMIQACCDCMNCMMKAGCTCCVMMNNTPVCCGC